MEVEDGNSQWIERFKKCLENPDSKEEVSELVLDIEKLAQQIAKKKLTIDPHIFTKWIVDLGIKTSNLEQGIRLLSAGIKMNFASVNLLETDLSAFLEIICYDKKQKKNLKDDETLRKEKMDKKQREAERRKAKWKIICDSISEKYESEKNECCVQKNFDVKKELLKACITGGDNSFETVFNEHKLFIDERLNKLRRTQKSIKIRKQKKKAEKKIIEKVHFDDAYFEVATSNYEESNVRGLISLNARRDVHGKILKINGKCEFKPKQHELGKPSWFVRDFYNVVCECLKEVPSKELYRVHACFPVPPRNIEKPSGFLYDNYIPFVPEVPVEDSARVYADCMYIRGLSEEDALNIYGIDNNLLRDLNKLIRGEGNFTEVMEKLKNAIPKESIRKLIWSNENFDIGNKDNFNKVFNPYYDFETINMMFLPDLTNFEEIKRGKFRKFVESNGEAKVFFGREFISEVSKESTRRSQMFESSEYFDISQHIHDLSLANEECDDLHDGDINENDELDNDEVDLDVSFTSRNSVLSFANISILEDSIKRSTDVMEFSQLPRGVDQSHWKYKVGSGKKIVRSKSASSNKASPKSKKRMSSTSLNQITPKSSRILRSQNKKGTEPTLPEIKEELIDDMAIETEDEYDIASNPRRIPDSDLEEDSNGQRIKEELVVQNVSEQLVQQNVNEDELPSSRSAGTYDVEEQQSTRYRENDDDEFSDLEEVPEYNDAESVKSSTSTPMEIDDISPINSDNEDTLMEDSSNRTVKADVSFNNEEERKLEPSSEIRKPSQEIIKQSISAIYNDDNDNNDEDYFGPFGNIYDEDELEPIFLNQEVPKGYTNVVTDDIAHSFGYMAMKYSANALKIECTTNISYVNAPLVKLAIIDVLSNSSLNDSNWQSFNSITSLLQTDNYKNLDRKALYDPFKKFQEFKKALENLCLVFKSTFRTRIKENFPNDIFINGHHTLRSIFYCVSQIIPQTKDNKLHYLTFVNLLLHMNNKFEMTFIDPSTNKEPDGAAPVNCYVKKHFKS
ncbi:Hypothetical protein SRAE_2000043500 [Strongyloides ratti]|uniref:Uncharacterized protein n=1 Tax=Strongyloides ratti TaxID=34506 RepID=A0A090MXN8_STRRB|nr:Hypothetical protein SRAE_2000043500 [Strongyloides ratti]CEF65759.1 Hypothetical protein SRAE_2000043500 [Strongyloides ratti]